MSYKKYVESKIKPKISLDLQNYRENLQANLAKFLFSSDEITNEIISHLVNIDEFLEYLSELKYPKSEEYIIALSSLNSKRISYVNSQFREWAKTKNIDKTIFNNIQKDVYYYQTKLHSNQLTAPDIDRIIDHACMQSKNILEKMSNNIQMAMEQITWKNYEVIIEAIYPKENIVVSEAQIKIGSSHFLYEKTNIGFNVKECYDLSENVKTLVDKLKGNKYNPIVTLYMSRPISERDYYEDVKRNLCLGRRTVLSSNIQFVNQPRVLEGFDTWKIKLEKNYIIEKQQEYYGLKDDIPIKWIERINEQ